MNFKLALTLIVCAMIGGGIAGAIIGHYTLGDEYKHYVDSDTGEEYTMVIPRGSLFCGTIGLLATGFGFFIIYIIYDERNLKKSNP